MEAISEAADPLPPASPPSAGLALVIGDPAPDGSSLPRLARRQGFAVAEAADAVTARSVLGGRAPDVVLLDLPFSDANGLSLLRAVREEHASAPIVVVASAAEQSGLEEALALGAQDVLHHPVRAEELRVVLGRISRTLAETGNHGQTLAAVLERRTRMTLPGDPGMLSRAVAFLGRELLGNYPGRTLRLPDVKLAIFEALANAVEHGNLEIGFDRKASAVAHAGALRDLVEERRRTEPYAGRRIHVTANYGPESVEYVIRDEGPGFDPSAFDAHTALRDTSRLNGRGLALIRHHVDAVSWNEQGNEIRLIYRLPAP